MRYQKAKVKEPNLTLKISKRKSEGATLDPKDCQERFFFADLKFHLLARRQWLRWGTVVVNLKGESVEKYG